MSNRIVLLLFILLAYATSISAQIEVRMNPFNLLFKNVNVHIEKPITNDLSIELNGGLDNGFGFNYGESIFIAKTNAYKIKLLGKYYYSTRQGCDNWFTALYIANKRFNATDAFTLGGNTITYIESSIITGLVFGYKFVTYGGFSMESSIGYGQAIYSNRKFEPSGSINVNSQELFINFTLGYRFRKRERPNPSDK